MLDRIFYEQGYNRNRNRNRKHKHKKLKILVIRVSNGALANSKPCMHCTARLKFANIHRVYYSTGDDNNPIASCLVKNLTTGHVSAYHRVIR